MTEPQSAEEELERLGVPHPNDFEIEDSPEEDSPMIGERVAGERHFPKYTKGCWGSPTHARCWLCKVRTPVKLLRLFMRLRRGK